MIHPRKEKSELHIYIAFEREKAIQEIEWIKTRVFWQPLNTILFISHANVHDA